MEIKECKKILKKRAQDNRRKGYINDASENMFRYYVLELLEKIVKSSEVIAKNSRRRSKREPSKYNLFIAEHIKKGMTFLEAIEKYKQEEKKQPTVKE